MSSLSLVHRRETGLLGPDLQASSPESQTVRKQIERAQIHARTPASALQSLAYAALDAVAVQCAELDWDGHGALPISLTAYLRARSFLDVLPPWLPAPDVVPEPDGEIAIEWDFGPEQVFSVSIGEGSLVHFAGLFGSGVERHGVEPFEGVVSQDILAYITRLVGILATPRRAA